MWNIQSHFCTPARACLLPLCMYWVTLPGRGPIIHLRRGWPCVYICIGGSHGGEGGPCKANPKWDWSVIGGEDERRAIASHVRQLTVSEFADGVNNKTKGCRLCGKVLRLLLKYLSSQFQVVGYILEGPLKCDRQCLLVQMFIQGRRMFSCLQMSHPPLPLLIIAERLSHAVLRHLNRPHPWWTH